jgi:hypothetical protein
MDPRPINCHWPHCQDYDERCEAGINIPCIVIDGEHLELERLAANRGCVFTTLESLLIVGVTLAALSAVVVML